MTELSADLYRVAAEQAKQWALLMQGLGFPEDSSAEEVLASFPQCDTCGARLPDPTGCPDPFHWHEK